MEAIILAGGKGTRLRSVVADLPKPMADIAGKPFLYYQMEFLRQQGVSKFILAVGYLHEKVCDYFGESFQGVHIKYVIEHEPLGTGGGLKFALNACQGTDVLVCNGDTFFDFNLNKLAFCHTALASPFTFSVRKVYNTGRYGGMQIDKDARVKAFVAKDILGDTYINAGAYIVNKEVFHSATEGLEKFSLEDDFLAKEISQKPFYAVPFSDANFLDIGIPEDYAKSQGLIPQWIEAKPKPIETIFLDRDGVINKKIDNDYVRSIEQLEILTNVPEWIAKNSSKLILVITNQRGIERGLMTAEDVNSVHHEIQNRLATNGGKIEKFYFCPAKDNDDPCRKPNPGMLLQAMKDHPQIKVENSVLIGDSLSDLQAGNALKIKSIFLTNHKSISFEIMENAALIFTQLEDVVF